MFQTQIIKTLALLSSRFFNFYKVPVFLRVLAIWIVSIFILIADVGLKNYDNRFNLRSPQSSDSSLVILSMSRAEWDEIYKPSLLKSMIFRQDAVTDSYYWNPNFWIEVIDKLKIFNAKKIAIDFYFSKNISVPWTAFNYLSNLENVFWASDVDSLGRLLPSKFSNSFNENTGINMLRPDYDGILRTFYFSNYSIPQLPEILSSPQKGIHPNPALINFRGPPGTFKNFSLLSLLDGTLKAEDIKDKTIIIAPEYGKDHIIKTPLGLMNRAEIHANIIDNINNSRWIKKLPTFIYALILLPLILLCVWIILSFPQGIGITLLFSLAFMSISSSIFLFDIYYVWTPLVTLLSCIFLSYVIIISQMLFDREKNVWQMQKEQDYLKSLEELKTNFVSLISHDLKTPLAKIQSVIHRLRSDANLEKNPEVLQDLNSIYAESKNLDRYIKSILKLSKIESKDFTIIKKPIDINEVIEQAATQLTSFAKEKNILINLELEPMFLIEADKTLVLEIIINLLENAIKYAYSNSEIKIMSFEDDGFVHIEILDHGPGIKPEYLNYIFDKFFRGDNSTSTQGTGLGLFLVKYFIELHNGKIDIESELNKGTKVKIKIPTGV